MTDRPGERPEERLPVPRASRRPRSLRRPTSLRRRPVDRAVHGAPDRAPGRAVAGTRREDRHPERERPLGRLPRRLDRRAVRDRLLLLRPGRAGRRRTPAGSRRRSRSSRSPTSRPATSSSRRTARAATAPRGRAGSGPVLNDQAKLLTHLTPAYLTTVLTVGGRYVCGDANSLMPVWSDQGNPPGPLNYRDIEELVAFIRAPSTLAVRRDRPGDRPEHDPERLARPGLRAGTGLDAGPQLLEGRVRLGGSLGRPERGGKRRPGRERRPERGTLGRPGGLARRVGRRDRHRPRAHGRPASRSTRPT